MRIILGLTFDTQMGEKSSYQDRSIYVNGAPIPCNVFYMSRESRLCTFVIVVYRWSFIDQIKKNI